MLAVALIVLVAALVAVAIHRHDGGRMAVHRPHGACVEDVMSADVPAISAQLTVEEVTHDTLGPIGRPAFAVCDAKGHAVGVLLWDDLARIPHTERPARLLADVTRYAVVDRSAELSAALDRPDLVAAGTAVVVDRGRRPVGLLSMDDALVAAGRGEERYGAGVRAPADVPQPS